MLLLQRGHHCHHRSDKAGTLRTLGPKAPLAPEHFWPNGPLGSVVRGVHPCVTDECPQGLPQLQDGPAGALRLGHPTRLTRLQKPLHFAPDRPHIPGTGGMGQPPVADSMPPVEHLIGLRKASPISWERPPRVIIASMSRSRCAQHTCRRQLGYQVYAYAIRVRVSGTACVREPVFLPEVLG
jgi:hypothetical protein